MTAIPANMTAKTKKMENRNGQYRILPMRSKIEGETRPSQEDKARIGAGAKRRIRKETLNGLVLMTGRRRVNRKTNKAKGAAIIRSGMWATRASRPLGITFSGLKLTRLLGLSSGIFEGAYGA